MTSPGGPRRGCARRAPCYWPPTESENGKFGKGIFRGGHRVGPIAGRGVGDVDGEGQHLFLFECLRLRPAGRDAGRRTLIGEAQDESKRPALVVLVGAGNRLGLAGGAPGFLSGRGASGNHHLLLRWRSFLAVTAAKTRNFKSFVSSSLFTFSL